MREPPISAPPRAQFHQLHSESNQDLIADLTRGLSAHPAYVSPKFFYDELGSTLFGAITLLPEYYPTRTERALMNEHGQAIAAAVGEVDVLIDLGAADCVKGEALMEWVSPRQYVPVDISTAYLHTAVDRLKRTHPGLQIIGLGMDFFQGLTLTDDVLQDRRLFFYPGSSIGNLTPAEAQTLLSNIRQQCRTGGGLVIGVDRVKDSTVLTRAYDDSLGVTATFNLNVLHRVNTLLGADFHCGDWQHVASFDAAASRIDMHLRARHATQVNLPTGVRGFAEGECIHTESSYKYTPEAFTDLLRTAGFSRISHWTDDREWFSVFSARA